MTFYQRYLKRIFDILFATLLLVVLALPIALIALTILITDGRPLFFRQQRPGKNERIFTLIKFRTMTEQITATTTDEMDEMRLTGIGRILRKLSLDELPELFNILKGEMSFVGPRPLLPEYLPYYYDEERCRHNLLPGLTGLAQVNGRNHLEWDERLATDCEYVRQCCLWLDLKIIIRTFLVVVMPQNVASGKDLKEGYLSTVRSTIKNH